MKPLTKSECEEYIQKAKYMHEKILQSIRIRSTITKKRADGLNKLSSSANLNPNWKQDQAQGLLDLRRCLKNEKNLVEIVGRGLEDGIGFLEDFEAKLKATEINKEIIRLCETMIEALDYASKNLIKIRKRLALEEDVMKDRYLRLDDLKALLKEEKEFDRNISTKLNPSFLNKLSWTAKRFGLSAGIGSVGGMMAGTAVAVFASQSQMVLNRGPYTAEPQVIIMALGIVLGAMMGILGELLNDSERSAAALKI